MPNAIHLDTKVVNNSVHLYKKKVIFFTNFFLFIFVPMYFNIIIAIQ